MAIKNHLMRFRKYFLILFILVVGLPALTAQCNKSKDYIDSHYDSTQADFSLEFFNPYSKESMGPDNIKTRFKNFDCSPIWRDGWGRDGVLGNNYWRIQFVIIGAEKDKHNPYLYHITGKSKLRDTITDFTGTIEVIEALMNNSDPTEIDSTTHGYLYTKYHFQQDNKLPNTGIFAGTESSLFQIDTIHKQLTSDTVVGIGDDDYANDTFVGTWVKYNSTKPLKCIWGNGRLPFTFDFDTGDGDIAPNERYRKNGWQGYPDDEQTDTDNGPVIVKWWLK